MCPRIDADDEENEGGSGVSAAAGSARGRAAASGSSARTAAGGRATRAAADAIGIDDPYETFDENGETVARPPLHAVAEIADRLQKLPQFQGISVCDSDRPRQMTSKPRSWPILPAARLRSWCPPR